jgi:hypothetical protein
MPNGCLDKFICGQGSQPRDHPLEIKVPYDLLLEINRVLLSEGFCPKISDFGLSKLCKSREK